MQIRNAILLGAAVALLSASTGSATANRLRIDVSPRISSAPGIVNIRAIVEPRADNRALRIVADSGEYFRSSYVQLAGSDAAEVTEASFKNLPGGEYEISVSLIDAQGRGTVERRLIVVTANGR